MAWTSRSGAQLRYEVSGQGHRTLVLIHELGGRLESWDEVVRTLEPSFQMLRYDQRGAGESEKVRDGFSFDDQIRDLEAVIDAAGLEPPYDLIGVAAGAGLALGYAARHPELMAAAMLVCPATSVNPERRQYLFHRAESAEREGMRAIASETLGRSYPESRIRDRNVYESYWARFLANDPVSYALSNRAMAGAEPEKDIAAVTCPCLIVGGSHDELRPVDYVRGVAGRLANAELEVVDCGHFPHVQDPAMVARQIQDFLARHPRDVFADVRGIKFRCRVDGPADAPWMVFSNSLATNLNLWDAQVASFKDRFRILRYDPRGHGGTGVPHAPCTFDELTDDAAALLDWFRVENATFIGVSMGAVTGLMLAARHTGRVARVVAADGQWFAPPSSREAWAERMSLALKGGMGALSGPTIERWFTKESIAAGLDGIEQVRGMITTTPLDGFVACAGALQTFDIRTELSKIRIPVLLIAGSCDGAMPQVMKQMHPAIHGSSFHIIDGAGHLPNVEKPAEFNRLLAEFARPAPRMKPVAMAEMDADQRRVHDTAASGKRGRAPAPLMIWLRSPDLADRAQALGELARYGTTLPPRLSELAILVVARRWTSHYEWYAHKSEALKAGLYREIIQAIAERRAPAFKNDDERLVHNFSIAVCGNGRVADGLYRETAAILGDRAVVELVMLLGYYTLVAMTINTFEISLPDGAATELS